MIYGQAVTFGISNGGGAPAIFGDGSDGVGLFAANTTWNAETEDTGMIVKNFESLTISEGVTISAGNRNCGMIVRVKGDCFINGTLANKMSPKTILDSDGVDFSAYPATMLTTIAGNGGDGGAGGSSKGISLDNYGKEGGTGGTGMVGRFFGGGWSGGGGGGGARYYNGDANAGDGKVGGDGGSTNTATTAVSDSEIFAPGTAGTGANGQYGGGGLGPDKQSGGGRGVNGADATNYAAYSCSGGGGGGNYGGGVIILFVGGNLTIAGTIDCSGSNGGNGGYGGHTGTQYTTHGGSGGGGGGGGGGRIFICHKGSITNTGTLNVNGGAAGSAGAHMLANANYLGSAGTAGTIGTTAVKTYEQYKKEDVA